MWCEHWRHNIVIKHNNSGSKVDQLLPACHIPLPLRLSLSLSLSLTHSLSRSLSARTKIYMSFNSCTVYLFDTLDRLLCNMYRQEENYVQLTITNVLLQVEGRPGYSIAFTSLKFQVIC